MASFIANVKDTTSSLSIDVLAKALEGLAEDVEVSLHVTAGRPALRWGLCCHVVAHPAALGRGLTARLLG
jgi:hypothetical protein